MKIRNLLISLILFLIIFAGMALAEPQLSIPDAAFDFGYAPQNSTISHVFWLYSTGTDTLKIIKVSPG